MSTVPLFEEPVVGGPVCEIGRTPIETVVDELVAATRGLEHVRARRDRATSVLVDADGSLQRATARVAAARQAFDAYIEARVEVGLG